MGPLVFLLLVAPAAVAGGPIYRCGPGDYADNCDKPRSPVTVRYDLDAWYERTRGRIPCPDQYRRLTLYGSWVCEVPQVQRTEEIETDERLLK